MYTALSFARPLTALGSAHLTLPRVYLSFPMEVEGLGAMQQLTAPAVLQCLLETLHALCAGRALRTLHIRLGMSVFDTAGPAESAVWQSLFLKPLPPAVRALWASIDALLARPATAPALQSVTDDEDEGGSAAGADGGEESSNEGD